MFVASRRVKELRIDYTDCMNIGDEFKQVPSTNIEFQYKNVKNVTAMWKSSGDVCTLRFQIPEEMTSPVFAFYRLKNFYQNHRRYTVSADMFQLLGEARTVAQLKSYGFCKPLEANEEGKPYYPCGIIANSLFNDSYSSLLRYESFDSSNSLGLYNMTTNGTAWPEDRERYKKTKYNASQIVPPPNWAKMFPNGYTDDNIPDVSTWDAFQIWMRAAALPTFSKLALRNVTTALQPGIYEMNITYNFPVTEYKGTKTIMFSTTSVIGGKNYFLGILYFVIGGLCAASGVILSIACLIKPRRVGDPRYLSWNRGKSS
nr:probable membrane protein [Schizosaccharomyces pombe]